jgi:hypothetical protein
MYIGCPSIWPSAWSINRTRNGRDIMLGRLQVIAEWLPSKRERARRHAEWDAEMRARYGDEDDTAPKAPA